MPARVPHFVQKLEAPVSSEPQPVQKRFAGSAETGSLRRVPQDMQNVCPSAREAPHFTQKLAMGSSPFALRPDQVFRTA
jgi:hypothetical protein